jgi:uncharacterized protein with HEPN domain
MDNRAKKLLFDVLASGRSISEWCHGRTFADYERDRQFRRAVEREFEIIGEALSRLAQIAPETASRIENLNRIIAFRNRIIHGYDTVDDATVWGIAESYLADLIEDAEILLKEGGEAV